MEAPPEAGEHQNGSLDAQIRAEQDAVDRAYERLDEMRRTALDVVRHNRGLGEVRSSQSRVEWESLLALTDQRLQHLELGGAALCFGRVDRVDGETYQIGRLSVLDERGDPLVVDWRAPAAEPFYRATGLNPMGLVRRRHLLTRGRVVVGLDDEVFDLDQADADRLEVVGEGALLAALERSRTGRMGDIVATIQSEQDVIIRAPFPGILVAQGGPGTGKTAVALHRAAYLLYTNRQRLEDAGVLVVGPNRTFLRYIEHVLPSLGESGVDLVTIDTLYGRSRATGVDPGETERVKGDARMAEVLANAVSDRERPLAGNLEVPYGSTRLRVPQGELRRIVDQVRQRKGTHNARRQVFVTRLRRSLWNDYRRQLERRLVPTDDAALEGTDVDDDLLEAARDTRESSRAVVEREEERFVSSILAVPEVRAALERMWPLLTPEQLLHDLYGAPALLRLATRGVLTERERDALHRARSTRAEQVSWTSADLALLDEAAMLLGQLPQRARRRQQLREGTRWAIETVVGDIALQTGDLDAEMQRALVQRLTQREEATLEPEDEESWPPAYGHVIVDEAQDYSPMQWRTIARRCPVGSMTIVGDLGQASRAGSISSWDQALAQLPQRREPRLLELTINYRTPAEVMDLAAAVLAETDPGLVPPRSVRHGGATPVFAHLEDEADLAPEVVEHVRRLHSELGEGKIAVLAPGRLIEPLRAALLARPGLDVDRRTGADPLEAAVVVFTPVEAKGLEFDAVVLVEPIELAGDRVSGMRCLYVALTRATRFLAVLHHGPLPEPLRRFATADR
ncbi:MAG: AAA family ATPase [Acidimicrobiia bacterium]|nr:AAA family ATPase [Acidimicrobiia bacterium]